MSISEEIMDTGGAMDDFTTTIELTPEQAKKAKKLSPTGASAGILKAVQEESGAKIVVGDDSIVITGTEEERASALELVNGIVRPEAPATASEPHAHQTADAESDAVPETPEEVSTFAHDME